MRFFGLPDKIMKPRESTPTPVLVAALLGALAVAVALVYLISMFFTHGAR